jgi:hypothetical protein
MDILSWSYEMNPDLFLFEMLRTAAQEKALLEEGFTGEVSDEHIQMILGDWCIRTEARLHNELSKLPQE